MALPSPSLNGRPRPRGKTFGKQLGPPPSNTSIPSITLSNNNERNDKISSESSKLHNQKTIKAHRQAGLFADLDEAEHLTLKLLSLTSSTAQCLADGTSTEIPDVSSKKGLEQQVIQKSENGKEYLKTIQNIHELLSPYSDLVVAYKNHAIDTHTDSKDVTESVEDETAKKRQKSNMYAARVELRLALERKNVLQEALRLERQMVNTNEKIES